LSPGWKLLGAHGGNPTEADVRCVSQAMRQSVLSDRGPSRVTPVWDVVGEGDAARVAPAVTPLDQSRLRILRRRAVGRRTSDRCCPRPVRFVQHQAPEPGRESRCTRWVSTRALEHEHVLVVMQGDAPELINEIYVGISRGARASLAIALDGIALRAPDANGQRRKLGRWVRRAGDSVVSSSVAAASP